MKDGLLICILCLVIILILIYNIKYTLIEDNFVFMKKFGEIKN